MLIAPKTGVDLPDISFEDQFIRSLPGDQSDAKHSREVRGVCYSPVHPTAVSDPRLIGWSDPLGEMLGITRPSDSDKNAADILSGNSLLPGMHPYAARYGGHQFGHWAGQLGDGRAITLGELICPQGSFWEIQLKGAGPTPYSRHADGRAVLRSSLREFICSEAMHHLGVPTTRALSLVSTGDTVVRDMFYDGHPKAEPGAIVCRVAPTFIRFGNFQILAAYQEHDALKRLIDYTMIRHFPDLDPSSPASYGRWFEDVCDRTAVMVAHWLRVGFVHGVMNTDNMSILGLTIDYGPYGWLEGYDPSWTPNTTDAQMRRYCFANQAQMAFWNLARLADSLKPFLETVGAADAIERGQQHFVTRFASCHKQMLADKLGISTLRGDDDDALVNELFSILQAVETDMTRFFRNLAEVPIKTGSATDYRGDTQALEPLQDAFYGNTALELAHQNRLANWLQRYANRVRSDSLSASERQSRMRLTNPKYVLRNYLAQQAIDDAERGDTSTIERLLTVLRRPYDEQPEHEVFALKRPEWARNLPGCSVLSCSS